MINGFAFAVQSNPLASALVLAQDGAIPWNFILLVGLAVFAVVFGIAFLIILATYGTLWIQAWTSGAQIKMFDLVGMGFRKVRPNVIVNGKIMACLLYTSPSPRDRG